MVKVKEIESDEDEIVDDEDAEETADQKPAKVKKTKSADDEDAEVIVEYTTKTGTFSRVFDDEATAQQFIKTHTGHGHTAEIVDESSFPTQGDHQARQHAEIIRKKSKIQ